RPDVAVAEELIDLGIDGDHAIEHAGLRVSVELDENGFHDVDSKKTGSAAYFGDFGIGEIANPKSQIQNRRSAPRWVAAKRRALHAGERVLRGRLLRDHFG